MTTPVPNGYFVYNWDEAHDCRTPTPWCAGIEDFFFPTQDEGAAFCEKHRRDTVESSPELAAAKAKIAALEHAAEIWDAAGHDVQAVFRRCAAAERALTQEHARTWQALLDLEIAQAMTARTSRIAARSALEVLALRRQNDRMDEQRLVFLQRLWDALGRDPRTTCWHDPNAVMEQLIDAAGSLTEALASGAPAPVAPTTNLSKAWIPSVHEEALQSIVDQCCEVLGCGADSLVLALRLALGVDEVGR